MRSTEARRAVGPNGNITGSTRQAGMAKAIAGAVIVAVMAVAVIGAAVAALVFGAYGCGSAVLVPRTSTTALTSSSRHSSVDVSALPEMRPALPARLRLFPLCPCSIWRPKNLQAPASGTAKMKPGIRGPLTMSRGG